MFWKMETRVSFETSFDSRQPKLSETKRSFRLFRFYTETESFGFRLNRNKQKRNWNSLIESIFWYFLENLGLFRFVSKQFCLSRLFWYSFHETNRTPDLAPVCFSSKRKNCFCLFRGHPNGDDICKKTTFSQMKERFFFWQNGNTFSLAIFLFNSLSDYMKWSKFLTYCCGGNTTHI